MTPDSLITPATAAPALPGASDHASPDIDEGFLDVWTESASLAAPLVPPEISETEEMPEAEMLGETLIPPPDPAAEALPAAVPVAPPEQSPAVAPIATGAATTEDLPKAVADAAPIADTSGRAPAPLDPQNGRSTPSSAPPASLPPEATPDRAPIPQMARPTQNPDTGEPVQAPQAGRASTHSKGAEPTATQNVAATLPQATPPQAANAAPAPVQDVNRRLNLRTDHRTTATSVEGQPLRTQQKAPPRPVPQMAAQPEDMPFTRGPGLTTPLDPTPLSQSLHDADALSLTPPHNSGPAPHRVAAAHVHPAAATSVAQQIVARVTPLELGTTEIELSPAELGRVTLRVKEVDNVMMVAVSADRPETIDLLRRNVQLLEREFRETGLTEMSFSFSENAPGGSEQDRATPEPPSRRFEMALPQTPSRAPMPPLATASGIDIRL